MARSVTPGREMARHRCAAAAIERALALDRVRIGAWSLAAAILKALLRKIELASLAFAALRALDPEARELVFGAAQWDKVAGAGAPPPPLLDPMEDARWWAGTATRSERKAYCLAAFEAMSSADRAAFLRHANGVAP